MSKVREVSCMRAIFRGFIMRDVKTMYDAIMYLSMFKSTIVGLTKTRYMNVYMRDVSIPMFGYNDD